MLIRKINRTLNWPKVSPCFIRNRISIVEMHKIMDEVTKLKNKLFHVYLIKPKSIKTNK